MAVIAMIAMTMVCVVDNCGEAILAMIIVR